VDKALGILAAKKEAGLAEAVAVLKEAQSKYDANEA